MDGIEKLNVQPGTNYAVAKPVRQTQPSERLDFMKMVGQVPAEDIFPGFLESIKSLLYAGELTKGHFERLCSGLSEEERARIASLLMKKAEAEKVGKPRLFSLLMLFVYWLEGQTDVFLKALGIYNKEVQKEKMANVGRFSTIFSK